MQSRHIDPGRKIFDGNERCINTKQSLSFGCELELLPGTRGAPKMRSAEGALANFTRIPTLKHRPRVTISCDEGAEINTSNEMNGVINEKCLSANRPGFGLSLLIKTTSNLPRP